ncbi:MAG: DUF6056 family protein [Muribaculaceae bacterium]|nr:DUF6056 family protein [Muribaculaceae bacterium]
MTSRDALFDWISTHKAELFIAAVAVLLAMINFFTPPVGDDLPYLDYRMPGDDGVYTTRMITLQEYINFLPEHYYWVNARLGDKLLLFAVLIPKWIFSSLTCLALYSIFILPRRLYSQLTGIRSSVLFILLYLIFLPFGDRLLGKAEIVNYVWGFGLLSIILPYLLGLRTPATRFSHIGLGLLALICGAWHEGFAIVITPGIFVYLLMNRFHCSRTQTVYLILWVLGNVTTFLSPASYRRLDTVAPSGFVWDHLYTRIALMYINIVYVYVAVFLGSICFKRFRQRIDSPTRKLLLTTFVWAIANLLLLSRVAVQPRIMLFAMVFAVPATVVIAQYWLQTRKYNLVWTKVKNALTILIALIIFIHLGECFYWQRQLDKEYDEIVSFYSHRDPQEPIFYDLITNEDVPLNAIGMLSTNQFRNLYFLDSTSKFYCHEEMESNGFFRLTATNFMNIVPTSLKDLSPDNKGLIPVKSNAHKVYRIGNNLVMDGQDTTRWNNVGVLYKSGKYREPVILRNLFTSSDGHIWTYLNLADAILPNVSEIDSISFK